MLRGRRPPSRRGAAERGDRPSASDGPGRARIGTLRVVILTAVVCGLAIGGLYGPQLTEGFDLETIEDGIPYPDRGSPPPVDDRDVDRADPTDPGPSAYDADAGRISSAAVEDLVREAVDERRAERGLEPIPWDELVASVARAHSRDMAARDFFGHTNPDGDDPFDRFDAVGDYCRVYGENVATTWVDRPVDADDGTIRHATAAELAEGLVEQWMNSPPHREAILDERWDRAGVGVYLAPDGQVYATHNFCGEW